MGGVGLAWVELFFLLSGLPRTPRDAARLSLPQPTPFVWALMLFCAWQGGTIKAKRPNPFQSDHPTTTPDHPNPRPPQPQSTPSDHPNPRPPHQTTPPHPARQRRNTPTPDHPTIPPHRAPHSRLRGLLRPRLCQKLLCRLDDQASSYNCLRADINDLGPGFRGARCSGMPRKVEPKQRRWGGVG